MAMLRCLLLLITIYSMINAEDENCPNGWTHFGVRCYKYFSEAFNWITAERFCQTYDANLASVHNKLDNDHLLSLVPSFTRFWVGAQDGEQEGQWIWSDGSHFNYTSWCSGEPNNVGNEEHCLELAYSSNNCWNDLTCSVQLAFVCAKKIKDHKKSSYSIVT
ncbi:galactose-specific lectin nattectin [Carassius gibelio]|uniref:galactose-specific lectin nattectin n=1 Tax=Carassius gibelio TaxID=101364 RepID=UPI002277A1D6|nr:galactose-specific lectin nattectin [Carassius gibelio]XP_052453190.1 galactose-specific lectin nattectin [Carassius gibelio]